MHPDVCAPPSCHRRTRLPLQCYFRCQLLNSYKNCNSGDKVSACMGNGKTKYIFCVSSTDRPGMRPVWPCIAHTRCITPSEWLREQGFPRTCVPIYIVDPTPMRQLCRKPAASGETTRMHLTFSLIIKGFKVKITPPDLPNQSDENCCNPKTLVVLFLKLKKRFGRIP